jgi:thioredoxin 1
MYRMIEKLVDRWNNLTDWFLDLFGPPQEEDIPMPTATTPKNVVHFDSENWQEEVLEATTPVLVDFTASWCGPCRSFAPTLTQIADEREGKLKVGKLDVSNSRDIKDKYRISSVPTLMVFGKGEPVGMLIGAESKKNVDAMLEKALSGKRPGMPPLQPPQPTPDTGMHNTNPSGPLCFYQHGPSPDWCSACSAAGCSGRTH